MQYPSGIYLVDRKATQAAELGYLRRATSSLPKDRKMPTRIALILLMLVPQVGLSQHYEAVRSYVVPEGEIRGIVLDARTQLPMRDADLRLLQADRRTSSDANGRFLFRNVPRGSYTLMAYKPGYEIGQASVDMVPVVGWAARFSLRVEPDSSRRACGLLVCGTKCASISIVARDVLTGRAPISPVALRVTDDDTTYWALGKAEAPDTSLTLFAGKGAGPFRVEVAAEGYSPWKIDNVNVEVGRCQIPAQKALHVWLLRVYGVDPKFRYLPSDTPSVRSKTIPP
jgi:hypothetical protein